MSRHHRRLLRRLTAALATVTTERDEVRAAMEEREMDMHQRVRAGYDRTIADSWRAEVVRAVAAERDACAARCDALRAEHAAALDAARREGALVESNARPARRSVA